MRLLVPAAVAAALCVTVSGVPAATSDTEVFRGPTSDLQFNQCVGELVSTTGMFVIVEHKTTTASGESDSFLFHYEGMTSTGMITGVRYVESHVETQSTYFSTPAPPMEFTDTETLVLNRISPTGAMTDDDYLLHVTAHGTISASGQVSPPQYQMKEECR
jgi:hypothetical protein